MKNEKELKIKFNSPLNPQDSETQTYGCRANNPDICGNCYIKGICAFANEDNICKKNFRSLEKAIQKAER